MLWNTWNYQLTYQMMTLFAQFFDKRDTFDFHIVNFPDLFGNIPTYISQLIRYSWVFHNYDNFSSLHFMLADRLFIQGFFCEKTAKKTPQIYG